MWRFHEVSKNGSPISSLELYNPQFSIKTYGGGDDFFRNRGFLNCDFLWLRVGRGSSE